MSSGPLSPTITPLFAYSFFGTFPSCRCLCESWWVCYSTRRGHTWRQRADSVVSTEQPWSVIPPYLRTHLDLVVSPVPNWSGPVPSWRGMACHLGRVEICLPVQGGGPLRPFPLIVLLPTSDPPDPLPYAWLGMQFLVEYQGQLRFDCSSGDPLSCSGQLIIP